MLVLVRGVRVVAVLLARADLVVRLRGLPVPAAQRLEGRPRVLVWIPNCLENHSVRSYKTQKI